MVLVAVLEMVVLVVVAVDYDPLSLRCIFSNSRKKRGEEVVTEKIVNLKWMAGIYIFREKRSL
jgi:hypothetical protein